MNYSLKSPKYRYDKEFDIMKEKYDLKGQIKTVSNIACEYIITSDKQFFEEIVSDIKYAKWNRSAYDYDKNTSDLLLKDEIRAGYNVAKRVSDIVNPDMIKSNKIYV